MSHPSYYVLLRISPAFLFLGLQIVRIFYAAPIVELGGDAVTIWFLSASLSQDENVIFDVSSHHHLRWGAWVFPYFLNTVFSDKISVYFLSTIIPSTVAGIIFILIASFTIGPIAASLLSVLWAIDSELYRATFQLLPTGQGLLPLSIICVFLYYLTKRQSVRLSDIAIISLLSFWLYGVKETNLFFLPGVMMFLWRSSSIRNVLIFILMFIGLYCIETISLYFISDGELLFGRIYELLFGGRKHLNAMTSERIVKELVKYYDGGWSFRFYIASGHHIVVYFISAFISLIYIANPFDKENKSDRFGSLYLTYSNLFISFFLLTSIFIVEIDPIVLGQPLRSRYLAILLPISYIIIFSFLVRQIHKPSVPVILIGTLILWMYISSSLQWTIDKYKKTNRSIFTIEQHYSKLAKATENADCIFSKNKKKLRFMLRLVPTKQRGSRLKRFISTPVEKFENGYIIKISEECDTVHKI